MAEAQPAAPTAATASGAGTIDASIAALIAPGVAANAWRADVEAFRHRRLWDENYQVRHLQRLRRALPGLRKRQVLDAQKKLVDMHRDDEYDETIWTASHAH